MKLSLPSLGKKRAEKTADAAANPPATPTPPEKPKREKPKRVKGAKAEKGTYKPKKVALGVRGARFVLLVGDEGGILVYMQGKKMVRRLFAPSPQKDHTAGIAELMRNHPKVPLYILADVLDQQYVRQNFPPVSSFSVSGLVKRRLERDFQPEDLKGSLPLGREKTGRKEWSFLLIALASTPLIQQWLERVMELPNEFRGVYLTPVEGQHYLPVLRRYLPNPVPQAPWQLLVTHNKVSGFRQIVLNEGKLVFSRVTQAIDDAVAAVVAGNIEQEVLNTLEYLRRLGFQENNTLEMTVITSAEVREAFDAKRFGLASAVVATPLEVAEAAGLEQAALSADRFGDVVMAACFAQVRTPVLKFETKYGAKLSQLYLVRRVVLAGTALMGAALLFSAANDVATFFSNRSEADAQTRKKQALQAELVQVRKQIGTLDVDVAKKTAIVAGCDAYMKNRVDPLQFVADIATSMSKDKRVLSLRWVQKTNDNPNAPPAPAGGMAASDIQISMEVEFVEKYADVDALAKAVDAYIAALRGNLPHYTIAVGALPWLSQGGDKGLEISFDSKENEAIKDGMNKIEITFWPKPVNATPDATASGMPPGAPPGVMP